jgi:hypothetical protein
MRKLIPLAAALAMLSGCAIIVNPEHGDAELVTVFGSTGLEGSGVHASEQRNVSAMPGLEVEGSMRVEVRVGPVASLQVEGDANLLPFVRTETFSTASGSKLVNLVTGGPGHDTLRIWVDKSYRSRDGIRVVYTVPQLTKVKAEGSGSLIVTGLDGGPLRVDSNGTRSVQLSGRVSRLELRSGGSGSVVAGSLDIGSAAVTVRGSSHVSLGRVTGEDFTAAIHGSGSVIASGEVRSLNVRSNGRGAADLLGMKAQEADLASEGSGDITAGVTRKLVAQTTGSGRITIYGEPEQRNTSGRNINFVR